MPPIETLREPARDTPIAKRTDVLVVGGGSAGVAAAVAAARAGADVTLVERYGSLGGLATGGLIALLLTLDDGRGKQVIAGLCQETVDRLTQAGACLHPPRDEWGSDVPERIDEYAGWGLIWGGSRAQHRVRYSVAYDPEVLRDVYAQMVTDAGVDLLFHMWGADALIEDNRLCGVAFQSKAGRSAILAEVVIDATGDGDVFSSAGCEFELEKVHPWLWFRLGGVALGEDETPGPRSGYFRTPNPGQVLFPWGSAARIDRKIDATDPRDLTHAELECRRMVMQEILRLRAEDPLFSRAHLCNLATQLGITESRRLVGAHVLKRDEMDRDFDDAIAITGHWTKYDTVYAIPYGCLRAREFRNLLAAGRNISVDHRVHHATKEIPACMAVGQAAGLAASLALDRKADVGAIDVRELRARLSGDGALLDYFETA